LNEIGEADFIIYDAWGQGIPITDSMQAVITAGLSTMAIMAVLKDILEEVIE
jgi:ethanolamine ammonia-lyase small subunit